MHERQFEKWKVFAARSVYLIMGFAEQRSFGEMLPEYVTTFHSSETLVGWSLTAISGLAYLLAPLIELLIEKTSIRSVAIVGGIGYGASFVILGLFGQTIWHVFVLHIAVGFSSASVNLATYLALGEHFEKKFGIANSAAFLIAAVVGIVFPLLLLYLELTYGLRWALMLYGAVSWNLAAVGIWVKSKETGKPDDELVDGLPSNGERPHQRLPPLLISHPSIVLLFIFYGITSNLSVGFSLVFHPYGLEKGLELWVAALLISWYSLGSLIGRFYVFVIFKRNLETTRFFLVVPIVIELTMQLASVSFSNAVLVGLGAFFAGFATGTMVTWGSSIVRAISCESHFSSAAAWLTMSAGIGASFAGLIAGSIHDIRGSYQHVMVFYLVLNVAQLLLVIAILRSFPLVENCLEAPPPGDFGDSAIFDYRNMVEMKEIHQGRWMELRTQKDKK